MDVLVILLFMIIIGALIGGLTNSLAIKMLFRPYKPKYIGRFKIPFTPGLIPKRQSELAQQMGRTVVNHLLTPEGMKRKIQNELFYEQVLVWVKQELERVIAKDYSLQELINKFGNSTLNEATINDWTKRTVKNKLNQWLMENRELSIQSVLPPEILLKSEEFIPKLTSHILQKLNIYISSSEGKEKIGSIAEQYLGGRGFFGNMISSFLGGEGLADKIQPAISQYLHSNDAQQIINDLFEKEWEKLVNKEVKELESLLYQLNIMESISEKVIEIIRIDKLLQIPVKKLYQTYENAIHSIYLPKMIKRGQVYLIEKVGVFMERMNLQEIVREEVERFDVQRLEEMVLGISKRELKMITYLGALLGGIIGLIQGIIVMLLT